VKGSTFFDPARISLPAGESAVVRVSTESGIAPHSFVRERGMRGELVVTVSGAPAK